ncbi:unnamed protein product [Larinioides sclopetarius]|uniref:Uncharacterized protein n=1 Tax=Larinioides sclopetarius TaxID=280406 RepID=A0AAV1ZS32_9ARAC
MQERPITSIACKVAYPVVIDGTVNQLKPPLLCVIKSGDLLTYMIIYHPHLHIAWNPEHYNSFLEISHNYYFSF